MRGTPRFIKSTLGIIALTLIQTTFAPAYAQDSKNATPKSQSQTPARKIGALNTQTAPVDYVDAHKFVLALTSRAAPRPRGEFETNEAYEARQPKLVEAESVLVRIMRGFDKDYAYDMDKKTLSIEIPIAKIRPKSSLLGQAFLAGRINDKDEKYIGSNAFGAQVNVGKSWSTQYLLFVPTDQVKGLITVADDPFFATLPEYLRSKEHVRAQYQKTTVAVTLHAEPSEAERIAKDYSLLLLIRDRGVPLVHEATLVTKPTISEPRDTVLFTRAIEVDLMEIVVRDGKTGKTLLKKLVFDAPSSPIAESVPVENNSK